jgi:hypothetical protein
MQRLCLAAEQLKIGIIAGKATSLVAKCQKHI